ncbi:NUDIX domain-containing protein [Mangrovivirga cuniculi]|uniref:Nudix hydrolase domain-containing protein n=1 Tax=Mangrovivirga cuniculi TaxID=2715131 RepID=A0A4D7JRD1_9BACT|nr:NUDIX hydrolase [Mangrovivirga cuniculi]QCK16080.1 hypothetical protein DCC35_15690 [Mangrovivirga cuniculi]
MVFTTPGGGIDFGEEMHEALKREIKEETFLDIKNSEYLFMSEFIQEPYHAIEHFFLVEEFEGNARVGSDPELDENNQMIMGIEWHTEEELNNINNHRKHRIFNIIPEFEELKKASGFLTVVSDQKNT